MNGQKAALCNGVGPLTTPTVGGEPTAVKPITSSLLQNQYDDQDAEPEGRTLLDFTNPGPATLLFCLFLNVLVTVSWYILNIDMQVSESATMVLACRVLYDSFVLVPMGLFSLFECLYCFAVQLCVRHEDRALCIARVGLGGMLGASLVVKYGLSAGVFEAGAWGQLCFWALAGVLPGAGFVALVGFCWDCVYWNFARDEEQMVDKKKPLLEKEEV